MILPWESIVTTASGTPTALATSSKPLGATGRCGCCNAPRRGRSGGAACRPIRPCDRRRWPFGLTRAPANLDGNGGRLGGLRRAGDRRVDLAAMHDVPAERVAGMELVAEEVFLRLGRPTWPRPNAADNPHALQAMSATFEFVVVAVCRASGSETCRMRKPVRQLMRAFMLESFRVGCGLQRRLTISA